MKSKKSSLGFLKSSKSSWKAHYDFSKAQKAHENSLGFQGILTSTLT